MPYIGACGIVGTGASAFGRFPPLLSAAAALLPLAVSGGEGALTDPPVVFTPFRTGPVLPSFPTGLVVVGCADGIIRNGVGNLLSAYAGFGGYPACPLGDASADASGCVP